MVLCVCVCVEQESLENGCVFSLEQDNKQSQRLRCDLLCTCCWLEEPGGSISTTVQSESEEAVGTFPQT